MDRYYGINAPFIEQYIAFKRNMGYAYTDTYVFKMFDRFTVDHQASTIGLTRELAAKWNEKRPNESQTTRYKRVNNIINFTIYISHLGYETYIPRQINNYRTTFTPYIFSKAELDAFFYACDKLDVHHDSPMKQILPVVFRLIYGCGLRANEALSLRCSDIDLEGGSIILRKTKNGCERKLPLSDSLRIICTRYQQIQITKQPKDYFFSKVTGQKYSADTLYRWFRKILWKSGISHGGRGKGPRVHDFRHTFSVHSLAEMSRKGLDLYYSLPVLSQYLGHNSLEATDKYVRLTADMYPELMQEVNQLCSYLFPGVNK
ncbi:MAG: tyrosine-type recombinase/integrase [Sporolactobacillus sp.]